LKTKEREEKFGEIVKDTTFNRRMGDGKFTALKFLRKSPLVLLAKVGWR
jgi:hypothetical protein